jgi:ABC-type dipeptide/oligopeptide/nickel transport system ATPase component
MSELDEVREVLNILDGMSRTELLAALAEAHETIKRLETKNGDVLQQKNIALNGRDLYARRCNLAVAICRDDEDGLSMDTLNRIAEIIWPSADISLTPTSEIITG